jgi:hypothetical protein
VQSEVDVVSSILLSVLLSTAQAKKIPVVVNIGIGPTLAAVGSPSGGMSTSAGLSLQVEGWVSKKTLRSKAVRRRVPSQYRGMLKKMDDLHVVPLPLWVVPDAVWLAELPLLDDSPEATLQGASWAPWSVHLAHSTEGLHSTVALSPRVSWLRYSTEGEDPLNVPWIGASLDPEIQSNMSNQVGFAAAASIGAGYAPELDTPELGLSGRPWLQASASLRLQIRVPIKIQL